MAPEYFALALQSRKLCSSCTSMLTTLENLTAMHSRPGYKHSSLQQIKLEAEKGCTFCSVLLREFKTPLRAMMQEVEEKYHQEPGSCIIYFQLRFGEWKDGFGEYDSGKRFERNGIEIEWFPDSEKEYPLHILHAEIIQIEWEVHSPWDGETPVKGPPFRVYKSQGKKRLLYIQDPS